MKTLKMFQPKFDFLWIILALIVFCLVISLTACRTRPERAIKRIGVEPIAMVIIRDYPQYLTADTVKIDTIINVPFEVKVPEFVYDTIIKPTVINNCKELHYTDKRITISFINGRFSYVVKTHTIKDTTKAHLAIIKPVGLCPQRALLNAYIKENAKQILKTQKEKESKENWRRYALVTWFILLVIILLVLFKNVIKAYLKTLPF